MQITETNFPRCQMTKKDSPIGECGERAITTFGNGKDKKWMCGGCFITYEKKVHKLREKLWLEE